MISNTAVDGIWMGQRGNKGATFAHWQIALIHLKADEAEWYAANDATSG